METTPKYIVNGVNDSEFKNTQLNGQSYEHKPLRETITDENIRGINCIARRLDIQSYAWPSVLPVIARDSLINR